METLRMRKISTIFIKIYYKMQQLKSNLKRKDYTKTVLELMNYMNCDKCIENKMLLYDAIGNEIAILYELKSGYVIVDKSTNEICEFSLTSRCKYFENKNNHYIYAGPLSYYEEKEEGICTELTTNLVIPNTQVQEKIELAKVNYIKKKNTLRNKKSKNKKGMPYKEKKIGGIIPNISYNPNGVCGSCAVSNFLSYLYKNINQKYISNNYIENGQIKEEELVKSIIPYIEGEESLNIEIESEGSDENRLLEGLEKYLYDNNIEEKFKKSYLTVLKGRGIINKGFPFIMGLYSTLDNPYGNHWVVAISYLYKLSSFMAMYYGIIDGWGSNDVYINVAWSDVTVWIEF